MGLFVVHTPTPSSFNSEQSARGTGFRFSVNPDRATKSELSGFETCLSRADQQQRPSPKASRVTDTPPSSPQRLKLRSVIPSANHWDGSAIVSLIPGFVAQSTFIAAQRVWLYPVPHPNTGSYSSGAAAVFRGQKSLAEQSNPLRDHALALPMLQFPIALVSVCLVG